MVRWRAIAFGVSVQGLLAFLAYLVPVIGHLMLGFGGGFAAGTLGGGRARGGALNGTLTGIAGTLLVTAIAIVAAVAVGALGSPIARILQALSPAYGGVLALGTGPLLVVGALGLFASSVLGGLIGGWLRGDRALPTLPPEERAREREGDR
ncbi:MAG: hypothetical protein ABEJ35_01785 [Halobacteriaceae archaeon]